MKKYLALILFLHQGFSQTKPIEQLKKGNYYYNKKTIKTHLYGMKKLQTRVMLKHSII